MKIFLQTRGRNNDYTFLGIAPSDLWWLQYRNQTSFEEPTIIVHSNVAGWRVCLSGIGSNRKDRIGTAIRYTIILDDTHDNKPAATAVKIVGAWLADVAAKSSFGILQEALDNEFPEKFIETIIGDKNQKFSGEVSERIDRALQLQTKSVVEMSAASSDDVESWLGSVEKKTPRTEFMLHVQALLNGNKCGRALFLNLLGTKKEAQAIVDAEQGLETAILIEDGTAKDEVIALEKKNSEIIPPISSPSVTSATSTNKHNTKRSLVFLLAGGILLGLVIWFIFKQNPKQTIPLEPTKVESATKQ